MFVLQWYFDPRSSLSLVDNNLKPIGIAQTRGNLIRGMDAFARKLRTEYGINFQHKHQFGVGVRVITNRKPLKQGGYALGVWNGSWIQILATYSHNPYKDPEVLGRLITHEWMHSQRVNFGGRYGHTNDPNDIFSLNCGSKLTSSLSWFRSKFGTLQSRQSFDREMIKSDSKILYNCGESSVNL